MRALEVWITEPRSVEIRPVDVPEPERGELRIRTHVCGISTGTELLAYTGDVPVWNDDTSIDPHAGVSSYPMRTGYCSVGVVESTGIGVDPALTGTRVFTFHPHGSYATSRQEDVIPLPASVNDELATFIPNLETAIGLVMDAQPRIGERVVVLGQGIVGLLVTRLLSRFPLGVLATSDHLPARRARSLASGAALSIDPSSETERKVLAESLGEDNPGADVVLELTGSPDALNDAISLAGYGGRIVVGSWYGSRPANLDLGGRFHRNRISLASSQVSTIAPDLSARWSKSRRINEVLRLLPALGLEDLITHRFHLAEAASAFNLLAMAPQTAMQVVLNSDEPGKHEKGDACSA